MGEELICASCLIAIRPGHEDEEAYPITVGTDGQVMDLVICGHCQGLLSRRGFLSPGGMKIWVAGARCCTARHIKPSKLVQAMTMPGTQDQRLAYLWRNSTPE